MHRGKKPLLTDLHDHLVCKLCKGYFVDATTIVECFHTFCRSCIVNYLKSTKYCPVCDVQVHKSKPLLSLRSDKIIQDLVYKLVPRLFSNELKRRKEFYKKHPDAKPLIGLETTCNSILTPEEELCVTLNYQGAGTKPRYLRCPSAVSIMHLQKLIRAKFDLSDAHHIDILHKQDCLNPYYTLMDIMYIYKLSKPEPLDLTYRIYEYMAKKMKMKQPEDATSDHPNNNNNWKEVQLRISENGEMSITGIQDAVESTSVTSGSGTAETVTTYTPRSVELVDVNSPKASVKKKELPDLKFIGKSPPQTSCKVRIISNEITVPAFAQPPPPVKIVPKEPCAKTTTVFTTINSTKCSVAEEETLKNDKGVKRKLQPSGKVNDDSNKSTKLVEGCVDAVTEVNGPEAPKPSTKYQGSTSTPQPCYMPKTIYNPVITVPKPTKTSSAPTKTTASTVKSSWVSTSASTGATSTTTTAAATPKTKSNPPMGYKTLRDPPKSWNMQISKANLNKSHSDPKYSNLKNVRPAKFFKMRNNNMLRFLGNPASGVKPMYSVQGNPDKDNKPADGKVVENREIKKHSIVKIDPKTLKPISEKAPETSSLSGQVTIAPDLKINTSSVSIFNPLKLQSSSPKLEGKSPKSPQSPRTTKVAVDSLPSVKREKPNLNFTPPNPFVPNLSSQTVSPNQFMPGPPPGFPSYDPRVMAAAAYHNLFYGYPSPLPYHLGGLDIGQRGATKGFDISKLVGMRPGSPQSSTKGPASPQGSSKLDSPPPVPPQVPYQPRPSPMSLKASNATPKRPHKDSSKNEKSLQNTVEKLTLSRAKEINKVAEILNNKNQAAVVEGTKNDANATTESPKPLNSQEEKKDTVEEVKEKAIETVPKDEEAIETRKENGQPEKSEVVKDDEKAASAETKTDETVKNGEDKKECELETTRTESKQQNNDNNISSEGIKTGSEN